MVAELRADHVVVDCERGAGERDRQQRGVEAQHPERQRRRGGEVEEDRLLALARPGGALPETVRDDQEHDDPARRQQRQQRQPRPGERVGEPPDVRRHEREDDRRGGRRERAREAGDQAPGAVGADHAREQSQVAVQHGGDEADIDLVVVGRDAPHRRGQLGEPARDAPPAREPALVVPRRAVRLGALADEALDEPRDDVARAATQAERAERRERDDPDAVWKQHDAQADRLAGELRDVDRSLHRKTLRLEEHEDPNHPVVALATKRIEELSARRHAITEAIEQLKAVRPAGGRPDEILALLDAVPDLRPTFKGGDPEQLAALFRDFDVTASYDKNAQRLQLSALVTAELVTDAEKKRPPEGRSRDFGIAGAGFRTRDLRVMSPIQVVWNAVLRTIQAAVRPRIYWR